MEASAIVTVHGRFLTVSIRQGRENENILSMAGGSGQRVQSPEGEHKIPKLGVASWTCCFSFCSPSLDVAPGREEHSHEQTLNFILSSSELLSTRVS